MHPAKIGRGVVLLGVGPSLGEEVSLEKTEASQIATYQSFHELNVENTKIKKRYFRCIGENSGKSYSNNSILDIFMVDDI